ncbi:hypothetical protein EMEDMD4_560009 [Sinorhizobium medicae]|uniref:Uncharacterized protein n=1 Tax=Sinorhizobium medicae TaxID=110321 RepID=A0A508X396_9HYPH|nr:hypothetical protein EMEDMD4_560009 [Sinorhizobium medicae]
MKKEKRETCPHSAAAQAPDDFLLTHKFPIHAGFLTPDHTGIAKGDSGGCFWRPRKVYPFVHI